MNGTVSFLPILSIDQSLGDADTGFYRAAAASIDPANAHCCRYLHSDFDQQILSERVASFNQPIGLQELLSTSDTWHYVLQNGASRLFREMSGV